MCNFCGYKYSNIYGDYLQMEADDVIHNIVGDDKVLDVNTLLMNTELGGMYLCYSGKGEYIYCKGDTLLVYRCSYMHKWVSGVTRSYLNTTITRDAIGGIILKSIDLGFKLNFSARRVYYKLLMGIEGNCEIKEHMLCTRGSKYKYLLVHDDTNIPTLKCLMLDKSKAGVVIGNRRCVLSVDVSTNWVHILVYDNTTGELLGSIDTRITYSYKKDIFKRRVELDIQVGNNDRLLLKVKDSEYEYSLIKGCIV